MPVFAIGLVLTSGHYKKQIYFTDSQFEQVKLKKLCLVSGVVIEFIHDKPH